MGGLGSGRRHLQAARYTVEECLQLDIRKVVRDRLAFVEGVPGIYVWTKARTGERTGSVRLCVHCSGAAEKALWLAYTAEVHGVALHMRQRVWLTTSRPHFGGIRWWFRCPLGRDGRGYGRRVAKLYLPPGRTAFGCRDCHDLTYTGCQESHRNDAALAALARDMGSTLKKAKGALLARP